MKKLMYCLLIGSFLLIQSCLIPSVHPLYTQEVLEYEPLLEGIWTNLEKGDDFQEWQFTKDGSAYYLTHYDENIGYFEVHLVKLGDDYFLDFYPSDLDRAAEYNATHADRKQIISEKRESYMNELFAVHLLPVHTFAKLNIISNNEIEIRMFDPGWLEELLKKRKIKIKHEKLNDYYLITADSRELQKFVSKYADLDEAYIDSDYPLILHKSAAK